MSKRFLDWVYRVSPQSWHTRPMDKCRHPYCVLTRWRESR